MKNNDRDISQLGMILQGIIEPRVNGGYKVYETAFLSENSDYHENDKASVLTLTKTLDRNYLIRF